MTRRQLIALVERWRLILLPEWRVVVMDGPPPDDDRDGYWAISQTKDDYREINVYFTPECVASDHCEVTVVHELLHALTRPWRQQVSGLSGIVSYDSFRALDRAREHEEEQLVDRIARVLVGLTGAPARYAAYGTREFEGGRVGDAT